MLLGYLKVMLGAGVVYAELGFSDGGAHTVAASGRVNTEMSTTITIKFTAGNPTRSASKPNTQWQHQIRYGFMNYPSPQNNLNKQNNNENLWDFGVVLAVYVGYVLHQRVLDLRVHLLLTSYYILSRDCRIHSLKLIDKSNTYYSLAALHFTYLHA